MVLFEVYNSTLWNIIMMINKVERESCSLHIVHNNVHNESWSFDGTDNQFLKASIETMKMNYIPIVITDYITQPSDTETVFRKKSLDYKMLFMIRYVIYCLLKNINFIKVFCHHH